MTISPESGVTDNFTEFAEAPRVTTPVDPVDGYVLWIPEKIRAMFAGPSGSFLLKFLT